MIRCDVQVERDSHRRAVGEIISEKGPTLSINDACGRAPQQPRQQHSENNPRPRAIPPPACEDEAPRWWRQRCLARPVRRNRQHSIAPVFKQITLKYIENQSGTLPSSVSLSHFHPLRGMGLPGPIVSGRQSVNPQTRDDQTSFGNCMLQTAPSKKNTWDPTGVLPRKESL